MKTGVLVSDAMTEKPIILSEHTTLIDCAKQMEEHHVGSILIREKDSVLGILTEQDIVRKAIAHGKDPKETQIRDIMEQNVITVEPDKDIFEALEIMRDNNFRHLPVVDGKRMLGLLTMKDILKIEPQLFEILVEKFELRESERKPRNKATEKEGVCQNCADYSDSLEDVDNVLMCEKCRSEI